MDNMRISSMAGGIGGVDSRRVMRFDTPEATMNVVRQAYWRRDPQLLRKCIYPEHPKDWSLRQTLKSDKFAKELLDVMKRLDIRIGHLKQESENERIYTRIQKDYDEGGQVVDRETGWLVFRKYGDKWLLYDM